MPKERLEQAKLHSTKGGSDKVYELWIESVSRPIVGDYYNVMYANGRRSSGATSGNKPKNPYPMSRIRARSFLQELIDEKVDRGYHLYGQCNMCKWNDFVYKYEAPMPPTKTKNPLLTMPPPEVIPYSPKPKKSKPKNPYAAPVPEKPKTVAPEQPIRTIAFDDEDL